MNDSEKQNEFMGWNLLPARLDVFQTACVLGFKPHDIPVLTASGLLKPLGHPGRNSIKFYHAETLQQLRRDEKWVSRACDTVARHWREKNARKQSTDGHAPQRKPKLKPSSPVVPTVAAKE